MSNGKPPDHPALSPYLIVADAAATIDFAVKAFDARVLMRHEAPGGRVAHAELAIDDSVLMLGEAAPAWPASPAHLHLYVADVDASFERAIAAGAEIVQSPKQGDDPDRRGGVKDVNGTTWWIATHAP